LKLFPLLLLPLLGTLTITTAAQDLEPKAYSRAPVGTKFVLVSYGHQSGDVLLDSSLPLRDVSVSLNSLAIGYGQVFALAKRQASVAAVVPYVRGNAKGTLFEEQRTAERSGTADLRARFAINLIGSPALTPREFAKYKAGTVLGASLTMIVPTGQYDPNRLVNLGSNRWSFKPEIGLARAYGRWILEADGGVWLFTENRNFFGGVRRRQKPLTSLQGHIIYNLKPRMWVAFDATYYRGGRTIVNDVTNADLQKNSRIGATFSMPLSRHHSLKMAYAKGVTTRVGGDLTTLAVAWQYTWF